MPVPGYGVRTAVGVTVDLLRSAGLKVFVVDIRGGVRKSKYVEDAKEGGYTNPDVTWGAVQEYWENHGVVGEWLEEEVGKERDDGSNPDYKVPKGMDVSDVFDKCVDEVVKEGGVIVVKGTEGLGEGETKTGFHGDDGEELGWQDLRWVKKLVDDEGRVRDLGCGVLTCDAGWCPDVTERMGRDFNKAWRSTGGEVGYRCEMDDGEFLGWLGRALRGWQGEVWGLELRDDLGRRDL